MSTQTNLHEIARVDIRNFPDDEPPFVVVRIWDSMNNSVTLFYNDPSDILRFAADLSTAAANLLAVTA